MTNEEVRNIWAEQTQRADPIAITPEIIWRLSKESAKFERTILRRDTIEWIVTIVLAAAWIYFAFDNGTIHLLPIIAAVVLCVPMSYATYRKRQRPTLIAPSLADHLRESIASVRIQVKLLRSVLWWYLAPFALAIGMMLLDDIISTPGSLTVHYYEWLARFLGGFVLLAGVIWLANQRAARKTLEPRLHDLETKLSELESSEVRSQHS